jgi:hypothetical protein
LDKKEISLGVVGSLLAVVVIFFHKPLFSPEYIFPWDFRAVQLPLIAFLRDELSQNRVALWNPYNYGGYPVFANIQACFFHPLVFLSALASSRFSWSSLPMLLEWAVILQVWIAGVCAYRLFRAVGVGSASAWTGAVMFETGSYFASRAEHIDSMMAAAWMPLAWLAVWKLASRDKRNKLRVDWLCALILALGLAVWGGFPQATVAVFGSTVLFAALLAALGMARISTFAWTCVACAGGIALAAAPFIPTAQLTELSVARYRADYLGTGGGLYWQSLVSLVDPNHYNIFDISRFNGPWDPTFLYLYSSIAGLLLAIIALIRWRNRITALFTLMLLAGMLWMLGDKTPVWRALFPLLPDKIRIGIHPEYTYCIFSLGIAGLAAIGLDSLRIANAARWMIAILIAADLFLVGSGRPMNVASVKAEPGVTPDAFGGSAQLLAQIRDRVDSNYPPWRYDTVDEGFEWTNGAPIMRIPSAAGISPMAPENAIQLRLFLHDGFRWGWNYPLEHLDSPIVDLLNVRYVITRPQELSRMAGYPQFEHIQSLPASELFENKNVFPRFFFVHQVRAARSLEEARGMILRHEIDLRQTAIVEQPVELASGPSSDDIKTLKYEPNSIEVSSESSKGGLLVLSETYYPGWQAWIDDRATPIYETDLALRGVVVHSGRHRIRMEFRPAILFLSLGISFATGIVLAAAAILYRRNASRIQLN